MQALKDLDPFPYSLSTTFPQQFTDQIHRFGPYTRPPIRAMESEHRNFELWRESDWRCEWWTVGGRPEVRLYLDGHQVGELADGPQLDLRRQTDEWLIAVRADRKSKASTRSKRELVQP